MLRLIVAVFYTTPGAAMRGAVNGTPNHGEGQSGTFRWPSFSVIVPPARGSLGEPPGVLVAVLGPISECLSPTNTPQASGIQHKNMFLLTHKPSRITHKTPGCLHENFVST